MTGEAPRPGLVTVTDLAQRWGISPNRVRQLAEREDFPERAHPDVGIWWLPDIEQYEPNRRRPTLGRPSRRGPSVPDVTAETLYRDLGLVVSAARSWADLLVKMTPAWENPPDLQTTGEFKELVESACERLERAIKERIEL